MGLVESLNRLPVYNFGEFLAGIETQDSAILHQVLVEEIARLAVVENAETGYVFCRELNTVIDTRLLWRAAIVIQRQFLERLPQELQPQKVVGVSNKGKESATILGSLLGLPVCVSDRFGNHPDSFQSGTDISRAVYDSSKDQLIITNVPSFTKGGVYTHIVFGLRPGENVLIVDDFCAHGNITTRFHHALMETGNRAVFAYLAAKNFPFLNVPQTGIEDIRGLGIPSFPVAVFTEIIDGKVIAVPGEPFFGGNT